MKISLTILIALFVAPVHGEEIWFSITTTHRETAAWETEVVSVERCVYKNRIIYSRKIITPRSTLEEVFIEGQGYHRTNYGKWRVLSLDGKKAASNYKRLRSYIFLDESFLMENRRTKEIESFIADQEHSLSSLELDEASYEAFDGAITSYRQKAASHRSSLVQTTNFKIEMFPYSDLLDTTSSRTTVAKKKE